MTKQRFHAAYYLTLDPKVLPPEKIKYEYYSHIFHAFAVPDEAGALKRVSGQIPGAALVKLAHAKDVRVIISVGGGMVTIFPRLVGNPESCQRLVDNLLAFVAENSYDGIDLDWEHPLNDTDKTHWGRLIRALRRGMDTLAAENGKSYELSSALTANSIPFIDIEAVNQCMDFINVMCYDAFGPWGGITGNHSPLLVDRHDPYQRSMKGEVDKFLAAGVPAHKLTFGLPYYSYPCYGYQRYEAIVKDDPTKKVSTLSWAEFVKLMESENWEREFRQDSQAAWYTAPDGKAYVAVDDAEIVALKTRWAREFGLRGTFCWELQHDVMPDGSTPLQDAAFEASK